MEVVAPIAGSVVGGLLGDDGGTTTQQQRMDPRMDAYVYGDKSKRGLLDMAYNIMQDQYKTGGLNPLQQSGLEMQRQFLMSPQYQQSYGNMLGLANSLMGGGIAGNPFTTGRMPMAQAPVPQRGAPVAQPQMAAFQYDMNPVVQAALSPMSFGPPAEYVPLTPEEETPMDVLERLTGTGNWKMRG